MTSSPGGSIGHAGRPAISEPAAYSSAAAWAGGPTRVYGRLAEALVARSPVPLSGAVVLDLGAGTGAASRAIAAAGGSPVALDLSPSMLRHERSARPPAVAGDGTAVPLRGGSVGAVVAACALAHAPDPAAMLGEAGRVTRAGGAVLASAFSARSGHPVKEQVERAAVRFGYERPAWYEELKSTGEARTASVHALFELGQRAGLDDVVVVERPVDVGVRDPETLIAWRLGMAHVAPFVEALDDERRAAFMAEVRREVGDQPPPFVPRLLMLSARAP